MNPVTPSTNDGYVQTVCIIFVRNGRTLIPAIALYLDRASSACSLLGFLGILGSLDSLTVVSSVDSELSELSEGLDRLHFLGNWFDLASLDDSWKSEDSAGSVLSSSLDLFGGGVVDLSLLDLAVVFWEEDELGLIVGQSLNVGILHISTLVVSSVINGNSDGLGESWGKLSGLKLIKRESSTELNFTSMLSSLTADEWSKLGKWSWESSLGFGGSVISSDLLVGGFVEEASNSSHPMFSQMRALKDIIVFYHVAY